MRTEIYSILRNAHVFCAVYLNENVAPLISEYKSLAN